MYQSSNHFQDLTKCPPGFKFLASRPNLPVDVAGAGVAAQLAPRPERLARRRHGHVDILLSALDGGGQHLARARVARVVPLPVLRRHPLVVDEVAQLPAVVVQPCLVDRQMDRK